MRGLHWWALAATLFATSVAVGEQAPPQERPRALDALEKRYGIIVRVQQAEYRRPTLHGELRYRAADPAQIVNYAEVLRDELSLYPQQYVQRSGLRMIVLCADLHFKDQKRSALPDRSRAALVYDVGAHRHDSAYLRHVIHHEFFHVVDWAGSSWRWRLPEWKKLNPPGFEYGDGGHTMQDDAKAWSLATGSRGFLNRYSTSSIAEDMAEVYAFLITQPKTVATRAKDDRILAAKVDLLKRHLQWFSPYLDDDFWVMASKPRPRPSALPAVAAPPPPDKGD